MHATKYTVTIEVELLSLDALPGILYEVVELITNENRTGSLLKEDGDMVKWRTRSCRVDFWYARNKKAPESRETEA